MIVKIKHELVEHDRHTISKVRMRLKHFGISKPQHKIRFTQTYRKHPCATNNFREFTLRFLMCPKFARIV